MNGVAAVMTAAAAGVEAKASWAAEDTRAGSVEYAPPTNVPGMFAQALKLTLRILLFRAGPQDFPYSTGMGLTYACLALALLANTATAATAVSLPGALVTALVVVASIAAVVRGTLGARKLQNRFQQTFNSLLTTNALLTALMLPPFAQLAPAMKTFLEAMAANPDLANHPEQWPAIPSGAALLVDLIGLWQIAVCAHIFRHAAEVKLFGGVLLSLLLLAAMFLFAMVLGPLVSPAAVH
jgi:hypothetical protein